MNTAKSKTVMTMLGLALAGVLGVAQISCVNPEQKAALDQMTLVVDQDLATMESLRGELSKYQTELKAIFAEVKAGKVPYEQGLLLAQKVIANISATQQRILDVQAAVTKTKEAIAQAKQANLPWYYYAIPVGTAALGIASMFVPGLSPLVQILASTKGQLNAVISGVEQYRKAPDEDPREIEAFIQDASKLVGVEGDLNKSVKALTGESNIK